MVTYTREILDPAAPDEDDGVFLQIMADAGDVSGTLETVGQADTGDLTKRGIRLFGSQRADCRADAAALRTLLQNRGIGFILDLFPALSDQLVNSGLESFSLKKIRFFI